MNKCFLLIAITILLFACNPDTDIISDTNSINDTVNVNIFLSPFHDPIFLDVDKDGVSDLKISVFSWFSNTQYFGYSNVAPLNNYEISIDSLYQKTWSIASLTSKDTIYKLEKYIIPKIYVFKNKINVKNAFSKNSVDIAYFNHSPSSWGYSSGINVAIWNSDEVRYIGFRKVSGNIIKIGWLKLKIQDYSDITLYSYKIPIEASDSLLIDK